MYHSKELGKARFSFFESSQGDSITRQYRLEPQIQEALLENQFELYYQPQIDTITQEIVGAEALVRWHHPTKGFIYPSEFIDIIEDGYLVREFGIWVITEAATQQKLWQDQGIKINMSVNLSVKHILSQNFYDEITSLVIKLDIDLNMFHFEITEYNIMNHVDTSSKLLNKLTAEGFHFCLDDFGTGYSSITHLYNLHINYLKIDKVFVDMIVDENSKNPLIEAVVNMAKALDITIVAEGVETKAQYNYLKTLYCETIQGDYFSKPLNQEDFHTYFFSRLSLINMVSEHD
jgi:EAL domain-containing protein (putative c-di-GMP-specific phosphodiesterase class I)